MGMIVYVYRDTLGDCTNGGISGTFDKLCVTNVDGPFEPGPGIPAVVLKPGNIPNALPKLVPEEDQEHWVMFGGNYASTSDSRFSEAVKRMCGVYASIVPIHDRIE